MANQIAEEFKVREDGEYKMMKQIEDKAVSVKQEIMREAEQSGEIVTTLQNYLE